METDKALGPHSPKTPLESGEMDNNVCTQIKTERLQIVVCFRTVQQCDVVENVQERVIL